MSFCPGDKTSWPELVGLQGEVAVAIIKRDYPSLNVATLVVGDGATTPAIDCNRVNVWVDTNGIVVNVPVLG